MINDKIKTESKALEIYTNKLFITLLLIYSATIWYFLRLLFIQTKFRKNYVTMIYCSVTKTTGILIAFKYQITLITTIGPSNI